MNETSIKKMLTNKKNLFMVFFFFLFIVFLMKRNKMYFIYHTILGRIFLLTFIISITYFNKLLGILSVLISFYIYNSFDNYIVENMETKEDTSSDKTKTDSSEQVTIVPEKEKDYENNNNIDLKDYNKRGMIVLNEQNVRPKDSKALLNISSPSNNSEPSSNFPDNYAYKSQESQV